MNYNEAMAYIQNAYKFGINYGLDRTKKILELLGNPQEKIRCIHIAGTNGKGSITAMTSKILEIAGYKVGMYTSPFIEEFEERIQINGQNIKKDELAIIVSRIAEIVQKVVDMGYEHPTEFEIITCCMFVYFYEQNVDFAVIEVGLGGREDSTNVITPLASVITSISLDHMNILGDSIAKIASEKAGIIKDNVPVISYMQVDEAMKVIEDKCSQTNSKLIVADPSFVKEGKIIFNFGTQNLIIDTKNDHYDINLNLLGVHQKLNCNVVINLMECLISQNFKISKQNILDGLKEVHWPARLELMKKNPMVVLDGAHNIDGIRNLTESIKTYFKYDKLILILGILADKQVDEMIDMIVPLADKIIAVSPNSDRAKEADELAKIIKKQNPSCIAIKDYTQAYKTALSHCKEDDLLLIAGSLYLIGDMRKVVKNL